MSSDPYPVRLEVRPSLRFKRSHTLLRLLGLAIFLSIAAALWLADLKELSYALSVTWLLGISYLVVPFTSAWAILRKGPERFLREDAPRITAWLERYSAYYAYISLITDEIPFKQVRSVTLRVQPSGLPSARSALLRLFISLPSAFGFLLLLAVSTLPWLAALLSVLVFGDYPRRLCDFQLAVLNWQARLFAYHTSLVDSYPPFALQAVASP
ncbi:MAG TPA: DUF4389 domain-containing protein, partial [Dehalococcoidia bacterium]|nr:DUF4389 domain-containing protein [Dehalococcoidia bacterium]